MSAERHLLFAVLAFENELLDLAQLTSACRAWAEDKSKPLADLLVERGWLTGKNREFIDELVERKLSKHQHDPRVTLNSVVRGDVCDAIKEINDADIQQSLSSWPSSGPVLIEAMNETLTMDPSLLPKSRYTWVSEVGKGGLGKVWLARDNDLAREVALKEVKPGSASTEAVRRLIKEAQITGQLQHPNIVPVYEVNRGGRPFYTMKLVKGETLSKAIRRHHEQSRAGHEDPLSLPRLLNVFVNVCEALAYAHSRGIIHRDLKPENIVLGDYGEAIVLDWGLAKQIGSADEETAPVVLTEDAQSSATRLGATPGTPAYMSPEQAAGRVDLLDQRTDIYGLGTILFEILTGQAPHSSASSAPLREKEFHAEAQSSQSPANLADAEHSKANEPRFVSPLAALLQRISEAPTPRARDVDPTISRELDAICATAMSKKRDERYLDAKALAADVKRSLAHQPVSVYRTGAWERLRLWRRRNPVVASLSLFLAVSLLTGSAVSTLFGLAAKREAKRANLNAERERKEKERADEETERANTEAKKAIQLSQTNAALVKQEQSARQQAVGNAKRERKERERADAKADEARRHLYAAHMNLVRRNWDDAHVGLVLELLGKTRQGPGALSEEGGFLGLVFDLLERPRSQPSETDLRGFEWHYWDRLCHSSLLDLKGHTGGVLSVAFSADGKQLVSGSYDRTVKVWDATTGQETLTLKGHTDYVTSVTFSADGQRLASAGGQTVKVWNVTSGQEMETLTLKGHNGYVTEVAFSADGKRLMSAGDDQTVKVWDATNGQETLTLKWHTAAVSTVAFSADGKRLASGSVDGTVKVGDVMGGQEKLTLKGHTGRVNCVAFSPDGKLLAAASNANSVKVWDITSGQEILTLKGHTSVVAKVAFSADGKRLASGSVDQTVRVWDVTSGQETLIVKGHTDTVHSVAFSADGKRLASASSDLTLKVWDATSGQETLTLIGPTGEYPSVAFSTDGKRLASSKGDKTVSVWDTTTSQEMLTLEGHADLVTSVAFSADTKQLASASGDGIVKLWDATTGQETLTLKGHTSAVWGVAFSANGKRLASASADRKVKVWDATSGQEMLTLKGHTDQVTSVAFSADGKHLATSSWDDTVKVWDATSGRLARTLKGHSQWVNCVVFSADGNHLASASHDHMVKVWSTTTGLETATLKGHSGWVHCVAFSPDGKRLASGSSDRMVKLWDTTTGEETLTLKGHISAVTSVAFSPDGKRLASAGQHESVKVWDARPWTPELRAEREALSLIHWLRDQDKPQSEWLAAIAADQTLTEPVRQRALQFAREWK